MGTLYSLSGRRNAKKVNKTNTTERSFIYDLKTFDKFRIIIRSKITIYIFHIIFLSHISSPSCHFFPFQQVLPLHFHSPPVYSFHAFLLPAHSSPVFPSSTPADNSAPVRSQSVLFLTALTIQLSSGIVKYSF